MANEFKIKNGLVVSGSAEIENNLTVRGRLTADEYHVSIVSSSVLYESGSTKFGDSLDDTHVMTGSLNITGSILLNGTTVGTGKLDETTFESFTSSYLEVSSSLNERVGDLESFSSSLDNTFVSETEFGSHTSSINGRVDDLETESGSIRGDFNLFTSSYTDVSTSIDSRLDSLETLSGSFTGSFTGDGTNLYNIPASGVTGLNLTQIADGSVTASVSNTNGLRVNSKAEITGSLIVTNGITGSIDYSNITNKPTLVSGSEQVDITGTTGYSTFSSSISSSIGELSSSVAATTNDLDGRLDNVETSTGSLNTFTSSINTTIKDKLDTEDVISGSVQVTIGDTTGFSTFSSSIATTDSNQNTRLGLIETSTGSLNTFTSSASDRLTSIETSTGSLNTFSSSLLTRVTSIESTTSSLNTFTSSINGAVEVTGSNLTVKGDLLVKGTTTQIDSTTINIGDNIIQLNGTGATNAGLVVRDDTSPNTASGSLLWNTTNDEWVAGGLGSEERIILETEFTDLSSSVLSRVNTLETESGSIRGDFNSYTSSNNSTNTTQNGRLSSIEGVTGSIGLLNTYTGSNNTVIGTLQTTTGSLNTFTSSASTRLSSLETESGSIRGDLNTYTSSNDSTNTTQNGRLGSLEGKSGSYATTGSNIFVGAQTISGSVIIRENLTVLGSSSITYTTSSQLRVDDNVITVNTSNPAERFGGLQVYDSGSIGEATGSLLWDSQKNRWVYQQSSESTYGGGVLMSGPRSSGSLGDELTLTSGKIARSAGGDHLNDSIITEYNAATIGINGNLEITGSILSTTTPLVSGSDQINLTGTIGYSTFSGSIATTDASQNTRLSLLETSTGSLNVFTSSAGGRLTSLESASSSIRSDFNTFTSSNSTIESTQDGRLASLETASGSAISRLGSLETASGSAISRLGSLESESSSIRSDFNTFTSSVNGTNSTQDGRLTSIESKTGSIVLLNTYTGSNNTVIGTLQTATSSLNTFSSSINGAIEVTGSNLTIKGNLLVKGTSTQIDSTTVAIGDNIIQLNGTGATNAGLVVRDATVPGTVSGSLLWDTSNDKWIAGTLGSEDDVVLRTTSQTLTNKTISGASNTLSNIANASLTNSSITIGSTSTSLGSTSTSLAGLTSVTSTAFTGSLQGNSTNITAYTINQNVGTGNTPTFAGSTLTADLYIDQSGQQSIVFRTSGAAKWNLANSVASSYFQIFNYTTNATALTIANSNSAAIFAGTITASNFSGTHTGASSGTNTGDETLTRINALAITTVGTITSGTWNGTTIAIANGGTGGTTASAARTNLGLAIGTDVLAYRTFGTAAANNTGDFAAYNATHYVGTTAITANRASASQTLTGVSIDGNAATSTTFSTSRTNYKGVTDAAVAGQLMWKNYGNNHTIFDASNATAPDGTAVNAYNPTNQVENLSSSNSWGMAPTLMGWNGTSTYGVKVDYARFANTSGNITAYTINQSVGTSNSPTFAGLTVNGNVTLGSTNGHYTRINDTLYLGASDSGDSHFYFGEDSSSWYGSYWYWDSQFTHYWYSRHAGTNTVLMYHDTRETTNVYFQRHILPNSNNSYNLGSASLGWANVYTNDLHLSNMNKPEGNDIDGTSGTWTIQEGAENLYIINNRNGKKFKISLEEIL